jgi:AcrR family transcriptional regulator
MSVVGVEVSRSPAPIGRGATNPSPPRRELQRLLILSAAARLACERGPESVQVEQIAHTAGVSSAAFHESFDSTEDCLLQLFDRALALAAERVIPAYGAETRWVDRMRAGLSALVAFVDQEPELASFCVSHARQAGAQTAARRDELLVKLAEILAEGARQAPAPAQTHPSPIEAQGLLAGVLAVIEARLLEPDKRPLATVVGPLMFMIALPYLGTEAARHELLRPPPRTAGRRPRPGRR